MMHDVVYELYVAVSNDVPVFTVRSVSMNIIICVFFFIWKDEAPRMTKFRKIKPFTTLSDYLGLVASVAPLELECLDGRWPKSIKVRGAGVCDWHMELDHQESTDFWPILTILHLSQECLIDVQILIVYLIFKVHVFQMWLFSMRFLRLFIHIADCWSFGLSHSNCVCWAQNGAMR